MGLAKTKVRLTKANQEGEKNGRGFFVENSRNTAALSWNIGMRVKAWKRLRVRR